jgi:RNA polymerase sigma factor (sigma-70 family)
MTTGLGIPGPPSHVGPPYAIAITDAVADEGVSAFLRVRSRLLGIACRMLGRADEAEDIVQDVWVRWQTTDRSVVRDPAAFLATTATRLAINVMQSARSRRETYVGACLPEPVDTSADPGLEAERGEALACGVLLLLEKLTPTERVAYVLREAFDYAYRDIANVLGLEEANARQVVTRARQRVANGRRIPANSTQQRRLLEAFIAAARHGDVAGLEALCCAGHRHDPDPPRTGASCSPRSPNRSDGRFDCSPSARRRVRARSDLASMPLTTLSNRSRISFAPQPPSSR